MKTFLRSCKLFNQVSFFGKNEGIVLSRRDFIESVLILLLLAACAGGLCALFSYLCPSVMSDSLGFKAWAVVVATVIVVSFGLLVLFIYARLKDVGRDSIGLFSSLTSSLVLAMAASSIHDMVSHIVYVLALVSSVVFALVLLLRCFFWGSNKADGANR